MQTNPKKSPGKLYYLIGASGVGKDSLLNYARSKLEQKPVLIAHRYITRAVELTGENHIHLSVEEFLTRQKYGCFLFHWQSHKLHYGIGQEVTYWLSLGLNVVINGSRGYLEKASAIFPEIRPVLITVSLDKLQIRLEKRGRENAEQIQERLQRATEFEALTHPNLITLSNNGELAEAGKQLCQIVSH